MKTIITANDLPVIINALEAAHGGFDFEGYHYTLISDPYLDFDCAYGDYYSAYAVREDVEIDSEGSEDALLTFYVRFEILDEYRKNAAEGYDDESSACDWDNPELVEDRDDYKWLSHIMDDLRSSRICGTLTYASGMEALDEVLSRK